MPELVIHLLEVVDVDQHNPHIGDVTSGACELALQKAKNLSAIPGAGQEVMAGRKMQSIICGNKFLLQLNDSLANQQACLQFVWVEGFRKKVIGPSVHGL